MAEDFVGLPIVADPASLVDAAVEYLRDTWPDWEPNDGDPEIIVLEAAGPMAAAAADAAATISSAAMVALGNLLGVPYEPGAPARTTVTLTALDDAGYIVPVGSQLQIDGYAFALTADAVIPAGETSLAGVPVSAADPGAAQNDLAGVSIASLTLPPGIVAITIDAPIADGIDAEDQDEYRNRIARDRRLTARTLITLNDAEIVARDIAGIGRAHADRDAARRVTVTVTGLDGLPAATPAKDQLAATYSDMLGDRLVNTVYTVGDADYTVIDVAWVATAAAGVDKTDLESRVNAMLSGLLSPLGWGQGGRFSTSDWDNDPVVRANLITTRIGQLQGMGYVESVTLSSPTPGAVVQPNGDLTMVGNVALPTLGTLAGTVH